MTQITPLPRLLVREKSKERKNLRLRHRIFKSCVLLRPKIVIKEKNRYALTTMGLGQYKSLEHTYNFHTTNGRFLMWVLLRLIDTQEDSVLSSI